MNACTCRGRVSICLLTCQRHVHWQHQSTAVPINRTACVEINNRLREHQSSGRLYWYKVHLLLKQIQADSPRGFIGLKQQPQQYPNPGRVPDSSFLKIRSFIYINVRTKLLQVSKHFLLRPIHLFQIKYFLQSIVYKNRKFLREIT